MNHRTGLEYFPFNVDFFQDEKIEFISARFGIKGEITIIKLLCKIYRQGYYIKWDEDAALLFAKGVGDGCQHSFVNDVVHELLKRGFFDKSIFESFSILTSSGIQKRYFDAVKRRKKVPAIREILLVESHFYQNVDITFQNVNILTQNADILKQSKVNNRRIISRDAKPKDVLNNSSCRSSPCGESGDEKKEFEKNALLAAEYMAKKIIKHTPNFPQLRDGKREESVKRWAADIEKLLRIDKADFGEFKRVLQYSQTDPFWQTNILSGRKLREQYGALLVKVLAMEAQNEQQGE